MKWLFVLALLSLPGYALAHSDDGIWTHGKEEIRDPGENAPLLGTRWGVYSLQHEDQLTLRLEIATDMMRGGWVGDYRSAARIENFDIRLVDSKAREHLLVIGNLRATGPASDNGRWKQVASELPLHAVEYPISWDEVVKMKQAQSLLIRYTTLETPGSYRELTFSLDGFRSKIEELESEVGSLDGGRKFILTQQQIDAMPINQLPPAIRAAWAESIERVARKKGLSVTEISEFTVLEVREMNRQMAADE